MHSVQSYVLSGLWNLEQSKLAHWLTIPGFSFWEVPGSKLY